MPHNRDLLTIWAAQLHSNTAACVSSWDTTLTNWYLNNNFKLAAVIMDSLVISPVECSVRLVLDGKGINDRGKGNTSGLIEITMPNHGADSMAESGNLLSLPTDL